MIIIFDLVVVVVVVGGGKVVQGHVRSSCTLTSSLGLRLRKLKRCTRSLRESLLLRCILFLFFAGVTRCSVRVFLFVFPHWADAGSKFIGPLGLDWRSDLVVGYGGEGLHYLLYRPVNGEEKKKRKGQRLLCCRSKFVGQSVRAIGHARPVIIGQRWLERRAVKGRLLAQAQGSQAKGHMVQVKGHTVQVKG